MTAQQTIEELRQIRLRLYRLRVANKQAPWLGHLLKAIETLTQATIECCEMISRAAK